MMIRNIPCNYAHNESHVSAPDLHMSVAMNVDFSTIYNSPESKQLRSTLHDEKATPTTIPRMLSSSLGVGDSGLTLEALHVGLTHL